MNQTERKGANSLDLFANETSTNGSIKSNDQTLDVSVPGHYHFVTLAVWRIVPAILISIGTVGNGLTIAVILRHKVKLTSTALFLLFLAISDILLLYTAPLRLWIRHYWNMDVRELSEASCKVHTYLTYVSVQLSSWLLVAVTLERVFIVTQPHRVKSGCTTKSAGLAIAVIVICILTLNSHFLYGMGPKFVIQVNEMIACYPKYGIYEYLLTNILPWIDLCLAFLIPFAIITSGNILIAIKLAVNRGRRRRISSAKKSQNHSVDKDFSVTVLLICLCTFFFVCLAPVSIYFIGLPYWREDILSRNDHYGLEYLLFWHAVANCIGYLNATCNFFFYVLSGTKFRKEIINLILCRKSDPQNVFGNREMQQ